LTPVELENAAVIDPLAISSRSVFPDSGRRLGTIVEGRLGRGSARMKSFETAVSLAFP
jgi:hypothetical protein